MRGARSVKTRAPAADMVGMAKTGDLTQRVTATFTKMPGPVAAGIAFAFYPGVGLVVPLALDMSRAGLVEMNLLGVAWAFILSVGWLLTRIDASHRRHLVEWTTNLRNLDAAEFEWLVGEVFRREGWTVRETGGHGVPDGNIDLELFRNDQRRIVQCKRWTAWTVGVDDIRGFAGTLLREGLPGDAGIFVTLSAFSPQAEDEAKRIGLTLIDGRALLTRIEHVRHGEPCPTCHQPMRLDRSAHGWWFRCTTVGCRGKRDLGHDPGRAVALMAQRD